MGLKDLFKKKQDSSNIDNLKQRFSHVAQGTQGAGQADVSGNQAGQESTSSGQQMSASTQSAMDSVKEQQETKGSDTGQGGQETAEPVNTASPSQDTGGNSTGSGTAQEAVNPQPDAQSSGGLQGGAGSAPTVNVEERNADTQPAVPNTNTEATGDDELLEQVVLEQGKEEQSSAQAADEDRELKRGNVAKYLEEVKSTYEDSKLLNMVIQQVKELIEIDNNLNSMIKDNEQAIKREASEREKLQKKMDEQFIQLNKLEKNMSKFVGLYELVTNKFNPFVEKGQQGEADDGIDLSTLQSGEMEAEKGVVQEEEGGKEGTDASALFHKLKAQKQGQGDSDASAGGESEGSAGEEGGDSAGGGDTSNAQALFHKLKAQKEGQDTSSSDSSGENQESNADSGSADQSGDQTSDDQETKEEDSPASSPQSGDESDDSGAQGEQAGFGPADDPSGEPSQAPAADSQGNEAANPPQGGDATAASGASAGAPAEGAGKEQGSEEADNTGTQKAGQDGNAAHAADATSAVLQSSAHDADPATGGSVGEQQGMSSQEQAALNSNVVEQLGLRQTQPVPAHLSFFANNGQRLTSISELLTFLINADDQLFSSHVNHYKNDFSSWVHHVYQDEGLSQKLSQCSNRVEMVALLSSHLSS